MPEIRSRVNGLRINIPADAAGIIPRFATKGGNDLVFEKGSVGRPTPKGKDKTVRIKSEAPDDASGLA